MENGYVRQEAGSGAVTARDFFGRTWQQKKVLDRLERNVQFRRDRAVSLGRSLEGVPVCHTRSQSPMEDAVIRVEEAERELDGAIDVLEEMKKECVRVIDRLPNPTEQTVLEQRYLEFQSWEEIANLMRYDRHSVQRVHRRAMEKIDQAGWIAAG